LGEIEADRETFRQGAATGIAFRRSSRPKADSYLESATIFWDYYRSTMLCA